MSEVDPSVILHELDSTGFQLVDTNRRGESVEKHAIGLSDGPRTIYDTPSPCQQSIETHTNQHTLDGNIISGQE